MRALLAAAAVGAVVLTGCSDDSDDPPPEEPTTSSSPEVSPTRSTAPTEPSDAAGPLRAEDIVTGLTSPWGLIAFDDGSMLLSERDTTQIKLVPAGGGEPTVVATIDEAIPEGEAGLLGLATTPEEDRVFVYYTAADDNRIASMTWNGRSLGEPEVIFDGIPNGAGNRHEGGGLEVGPDNLLYVTTGETGDTPELAQDRDSLAGKVLRLTLDGEPAPGNPFDSAVYSWGHRNVEGLVFDDRARLWVSEFGDSTWDELNLVEAGGNYGWPEVEGEGGEPEFVDPAAVWPPAENSPAGLTFWDGSLWMAGLRGETLWEIPLERGADGGTREPIPHFRGEYGRLRTVEVAADGTALLLATSNTDGRASPNEGDDRLMRVTR